MITTSAAAMQDAFAQALLDPDAGIPAGLVAANPRERARRFAIYRNNVVTGLIGALRERFPASERIVGAEFFAAMAQAYLVGHPPRSPLLVTFGDTFADFADAFPPAADLPYLGDVMRIEAARTIAYHACDAAPLKATDLSSVAPDALAGMRVALTPGMQILNSRHPAHTIWAMNADHLPLGEIDDWRPQATLVARDGFDVATRLVSTGIAAFLLALNESATLGEAAEAGALDDPDFDLVAAFALLIEAGLIAALTPIQEAS